MIQRIQSVYLLLACIITLMGLFLPWVTYQTTDMAIEFSAGELGNSALATEMLSFFTALVAVVILISVFLYRNRKRQMRIVRLSILLALLQYGVFGIEHYMNITHFQTLGEFSMNYGIMMVMPLISVVLLWMALRSIKKDEDLVRSVDRLR